jgi:hypothetical protein
MRRFELHRNTDFSGISGLGRVASGVEFENGKVVILWHVEGKPNSLVVWDSLDDAMEIHGHNGGTEVVWIDEETVDEPVNILYDKDAAEIIADFIYEHGVEPEDVKDETDRLIKELWKHDFYITERWKL